MRDYIGLTAKHPLPQYPVRRKIMILLDECEAHSLDWTHRRSLVAFFSRWDELNQTELAQALEELQEFRIRMQDINNFIARQAQKQAASQRPARILPFPTSAEALRAMATRRALQEETGQQTASGPKTGRTNKTGQKQPTVEAEIRRRLLAKVHIAKKDLMGQLPEFSEDTYRFILEMKHGVSSARTLSNEQLLRMLDHFHDLGWQQERGGSRGHPLLERDPSGLGRDAQMRKIQALLTEKGTHEGKFVSLNYALSILKRQTDNTVKAFEDATPEHLRGVISALTRNIGRQRRRAQ